MATELDRDVSLQPLADVTGLIFDRTVSPERLVGQAWLISKGRVLTLASNVSNYTEAPWALTLQFPHPNMAFGVRQISLHPEFNKREARDIYLSQAGWANLPSFENDIATVILDYDLSAPPSEKIAELNRALQVPFETSPQDMSGSMRPGDITPILQSALSTGRSGLITMVDQRNIPFARISINRTRVTRATYNGLYNENALCELLWKKPTGNFAFQPLDTYRWPADVPEMAMTAEQIIPEGLRRAEELPRVIEMLGGFDVRFERAIRLADFSQIPQNERWIAERLWEALDGFLPLSKAAERIYCDTYNTVKMIWDLASAGLIQPNQRASFHCNGQLGPMLVPAMDMDINAWDPVSAFFLDPVSFSPCLINGNCLGSARVLASKTLLHTITLPASVRGAAIVKDGKLIGIHTGTHMIRAVTPPPVPLNRMVWVGALNDFGAKRLKSDAGNGEFGEGAEEAADLSTSQKLSGMRMNSNATGTQQPQLQMPVEEETGILAKFSKQQLAMAAGGSLAIALISLAMGMFWHPAPSANTTAQQPPKQEQPAPKPVDTTPAPPTAAGDAEAIKVATAEANFLPMPLPTWIYKDSSKLSDPRPSFSMQSELKNMDILFIVWPNIAPLSNLEDATRSVPYVKYFRDERSEFHNETEHVQWLAGHYWDDKHEKVFCVAGAFPGKDPSKCIYFIARPLSGSSMQDMTMPATFIEQMYNRHPNQQASSTTGGVTSGSLATQDQLDAYRKSLEALLNAKYKAPKADEDADTHVALNITVDSKGNVTAVSLKPNANEDFNKALNKAFESIKPVPPPPATKDGTYAISIKANHSQIKVEEQ